MLVVVNVCSGIDDDLAFDVSEDIEVELSSGNLKSTWGLPDTVAYVGRVFHLTIPKDGTEGETKSYEVRKQKYRSSFRNYSIYNAIGVINVVY